MEKYEVIKFKDDEFEMDVNVSPNEDTVWLSQEEISILYASATSTINYHIKKIYYETELDMELTIREIRKVQIEVHREITCEKQVVAKNATTASDDKTYIISYYNLDVIIYVGYRVKSNRGIQFRKWANKVLKQYLLNGYVINENRVVVSNENYIELRNEVASMNNRIINLEDKVHDRYIILDQIKLYHLGASIKDLGKRIFSINELHQDNIEGLLTRI